MLTAASQSDSLVDTLAGSETSPPPPEMQHGLCRCQLIVWAPGDDGDTAVEPQTPQAQVPTDYTDVVLPLTPEVWDGRFMLLPPDTGGIGPTEDWIIEALDRNGQVSQALQFARTGGATVAWSNYLIGLPGGCEEYVRFQFRRTDSSIPGELYTIRARRPRSGAAQSAIMCDVHVRVGAYSEETVATPSEDHDTYATPVEPRHPNEGHETVAPPSERQPEPTYAGSVFLHQITPPGEDSMPLPGAQLTQFAKKNCKCQLIVWEATEELFEPAVDSSKAQSDLPEEYRTIAIPRGFRLLPDYGKFTLSNDNKEKEVQFGNWLIQAFDEDGEVTDQIEFGVIEKVGDDVFFWESRIEGGKVACEATVYFRFQAKETAPAGIYKIRGVWPSGEREKTVASCEISLEVTAPACSCEIRTLGAGNPKGGTVDGYVESKDGSLGVCLGVQHLPCAYPETVMFEIETAGATPNGTLGFHITSQIVDDVGSSRHKPLELKQIDRQADRDGVREPEEPDGLTAGKWKNQKWKDFLDVTEPCESRPPLRVLARVNTEDNSLKAIGLNLYRKLQKSVNDRAVELQETYGTDDAAVSRAWREATSWAWENTSLDAAIQVREGNKGGAVMCSKIVPIKARGGIWVHNSKTGFAEAVIDALYDMCGLEAGVRTAAFDWLDGTPPAKNAVGVVVPSEAYCTGAIEPADHPKGNELVRRFLCGTCCAVVMESADADKYIPFVPADSFPRGLRPRGSASHWGESTIDCSGKPRLPAGNGVLNGIEGTGVGTGGVVRVDMGTLTGGTNWTLWQRDDFNGKWHKPRLQQVSGARVLAHELAHLALGCDAKLLSGIKIAPDKVGILYRMPQGKNEQAKWNQEIAQLELDFTSQKVTGMFEGLSYNVPLSGFGDLGEYDAIMDWENDIAKELRELPRFSHS